VREWKLAEHHAEVWRAWGLVVAPFCTAAFESGFVRALSAGDTRNRDHPAIRAPSAPGSLIAATSQQIEQIRGME